MRIAQIAPLTEAVPPKLYGGTERVVSWLTEELVALGHDVTLFASGNSVTAAKLEPMWPRALRLDRPVRDPMALHMSMLEQVRRRADEFDVLHFHLDYYPFSLFSRQSTPFVTTLHGRLDLPEHQPVFNAFVARAGRLDLRTPSAGRCRRRDWVRTVYHGLPARPADAAADAARAISPSSAASRRRRRVDRAIRIAARCGMPLKIAAKVDRADRDYFEREIRPLLDLPGSRIYRRDRRRREIRLPERRASALLMPIDWPEPFGLVMIEAMACGTPVIAFSARLGAGGRSRTALTGFIVATSEAAAAAPSPQLRATVARADPRAASRSASPRAAWRGVCRDLS